MFCDEQAHHYELMKHNDELQEALLAEKKHSQHYIELFEFSPIGYLILDNNSSINQVNLQGASLLGMEQTELVGQTFKNYITVKHKGTFNKVIRKAFEGNEIQGCEVSVEIGPRILWLYVKAKLANLSNVGKYCLVTIIDITDRKQTEIEAKKYEYQLASLNRSFITLLDNTTDLIYYKDRESRFQFCSQTLAKVTGHEKWQDMIGKNDYEVFPIDVARTYHEEEVDIFQQGTSLLNKVDPYYNEEGKQRWISTNKWPIFDDDKETVIGLFGIRRDVTAKYENEQKTKLAASVFTYARESIVITDADGTMLDVNDTFSRTLGYSREEVIGRNSRMLQSGKQPPEFYVDMWQALVGEGYWSGEVWNRRKSGEIYAEMKTISAIRDENDNITHYVSLGSDITQMKEHQKQLEHIAHYDLLTNLPNRSLLADRLSQAMLQCSRNNNLLAVVFLDLDSFKGVNDRYGHDVGDELLIVLSRRMKKALRKGDSLARIGGDEFVAVLTGLENIKDCEPVLERLLLAASCSTTIGEVSLSVSASIGVTFYPHDNVTADLLMRHADKAMYKAKELGKNRYHVFDTARDDAVKVEQKSLKAIRNALDEHQFVIHYQPKVNMRTGSVIGVEALIRWQHPRRGLVFPNDFLPVIENHPMSIEVGEWVINTALTQLEQWVKAEINQPESISVNISAIQLQQPNFMQRLTELLSSYPTVKPSSLILEVLETSALDDVQHVSETINACMALGVRFALDDFGTGYSSLTYLRRLPADLIKIDRSFVRDMLHDTDDLAIVEGVIALAKSFKRDVIAEGVETVEHGTALLQLGCEFAQGYGIAKPMPAKDIPAWIDTWKPDVSWQ